MNVRTSVIYRYPSPEITNSQILAKHREKLNIRTPKGIVEFNIDRYWVRQNDAYAAPRYNYLLDKRTKSVIAPLLFEQSPPLSTAGFGKPVSMRSDGVQIVDLTVSEKIIEDPCLFVPLPRAFGPFLLNGMTGLARANTELSKDIRVLVPDDLTDREYQFLSLLGLEHREMIAVPGNTLVTLRHAITPSKAFTLGLELPADWGGIKFGATIEAKAFADLSTAIRSRIPEQPPKRLFITRQDAGARHLTNEDEAFDRLRPWGFERVTSTKLSPLETAKLFHDAEIIVGPASSGMLNLIFAPPTATVLEIDHPVNQRIPQALCRAIGMKFLPIGFIPGDQRVFEWTAHDHTVDIAELTKVVSEDIRARESR